MKTLTGAGLSARLGALPEWRRVGASIERTWRFTSFVEAAAFMNSVFALAEEANHHPDLTNSWTTVTLRFTTHDAGDLTDRDFKMAAKIDESASSSRSCPLSRTHELPACP